MSFTLLVWPGLLALIAALVAFDLGVFNRKSHLLTLPEAFGWTAVWFVLAMVFNVGVYYLYEQTPSGWDMDPQQLAGQDAAISFFVGYLVEKSLAFDNIFAIAMVLALLRIPLIDQHRILFWGVLGAIALRAMMVLSGTAAIARFDWLPYVFGALLIFAAVNTLVRRYDSITREKSLVIRLLQRVQPITDEPHGGRFFINIGGARSGTTMLVALVLVLSSGLMFAIDSIAAIVAITRDPFIIFTANIFAILGLRSIYFVLAGTMERFRYFKLSLVFLLVFVGVKLLLENHYPIPQPISLALIAGILMVGILASIIPTKDSAALLSPLADGLEKIAVTSYRQARKAVILLVGSSILIVGLIMIFLPAPAVLVIPLGLSILALEFAWAARWLKQIQTALVKAKNKITSVMG